ncbi:MAG: VOC family protein [Deltaproteobacteria bacterium]|nr:VOC family protein [Deltaproteobacteria bacterium]
MRLRQIALVAEALEPVVSDLTDILGVKVCCRDPGVGYFGLENALFPINGDFLEVVAPIEENTAASRYLERRGGNGGDMVILQCPDAAAERARITDLGIRSVFTIDNPDYRATHFHPRDLGNILLSIDSVEPEADYRDRMCPWPPGGPDWKSAVRIDAISGLAGVEIQSSDPVDLSSLWSRVLQLPATAGQGGEYTIQLDNAAIRFCEATDGRGAGVGAIDLKAPDRLKILEKARARGCALSGDRIMICGTRMNLL